MASPATRLFGYDAQPTLSHRYFGRLTPQEVRTRHPESRVGQYRERASGTGSLLVVLDHSRIGSTKQVHRTLDSLGLRRIGSSVLGPNEGWFTGQVDKVRNLVSTFELSAAVGEVTRGGGMTSGETVRSDTPLSSTELTPFHDGQFIRVERQKSEVAVVWSTASSLADVVTYLLTHASLADSDATIISDEEAEEIANSRLRARLKSPAGHITDAWIPFENFSLSWSAASPAQLAEAALIFHNSPAVDPNVLVDTGTDEVRAHARSVLARSALIAIGR